MPKEDKRRIEQTQEELDAEKFRTFFSTSVAQVPEAMNRREEETPPKRGLFGRMFRREKPEEPAAEPSENRGLELPPTGEILLGGETEEPQADLELVLEPAEQEPSVPQKPPAAPVKSPEEPKTAPAAPQPRPEPPKPEKPAAPAKPEKPENKADAAAKEPPKKKPVYSPAVPRSPMEQREDEEMKELKAMLFGKPKAPKPEKTEAPKPPKQPEPSPAKPLTGLVFAEEKAQPAPPEKAPAAPTPRMEAETPAP